MKFFSHMLRTGVVKTSIAAVIAVVAAVVLAVLFIAPSDTQSIADMRVEPVEKSVVVGETFTVSLIVESSVPVNVFGGEFLFDNDIIVVDSIEYNTSVADLWAEKPWYSNGDGTLNFGGGTTQKGGFIGTGELMKITFKAVNTGEGVLSVKEARILRHDGLGTDEPLKDPVDAVYIVEEYAENNFVAEVKRGTTYTVVAKPPTPDLNGDGDVSFIDVSIFMLHTATQNPRSDFDQDGRVNTKDLSILLDLL